MIQLCSIKQTPNVRGELTRRINGNAPRFGTSSSQPRNSDLLHHARMHRKSCCRAVLPRHSPTLDSCCCARSILGLFNRPRYSTASGGCELRGRWWGQFLLSRKQLLVSFVCCAPQWDLRSWPGWKTPPLSRSCSTLMVACGSIAWRRALLTPESDCRRLTASASCVSLPTMSVPRCILDRRGSPPSCRRPESVSKA